MCNLIQLSLPETPLRFDKKISYTLGLIFLCFYIQAQTIERFNTFSYNVNEGLLQSSIIDMAFDQNNFCWLSYPNGIQKFDGKNVFEVSVQTGLPDDKSVLFFKTVDGDLLISHVSGISKYEISGNRFIQVHTYDGGNTVPAQFIGEDGNNIYIYRTNGFITALNRHNFNVISETFTGLSDYSANLNLRVKLSDNIIDHNVALLQNSVLHLWDLSNGKMVSAPAKVPFISTFLLRLKTANEVIYSNYKINNSLQVYNFLSQSFRSIPINGKDNNFISRCVIFPWEKRTLVSYANRLFETDTSLQILRSELVNFQNKPIAGLSAITRIKEDHFGNLMIGSVNAGVIKIVRNNYPVKYYGSASKEGDFIISLLPDKKNNRILAGTAGNGLQVFDTNQQLVKHIKSLPGKTGSFSVNAMAKNNGNGYCFFINGEKNAFLISEDLLHIKQVQISTSLPETQSGIGYYSNSLFQNETEAVIQSQGRIYNINFSSGIISEKGFSGLSVLGSIRLNDWIITHSNDELVFSDAKSFQTIKKIPFGNTGGVRCIAKDENNHLFIGSNKGIFKTDSTGKILVHLKKENGIPDECIYAMLYDDQGFLWCSSNRGIFRLGKDNSILVMNRDDGLQENEFNTNVAAKADDGELFFGGVSGVSSFYPSAISNFNEQTGLFFTRIKVNNEDIITDTAVWNIQHIELPYNRNSISFDFVAMGNNNPDQYIYQYRMNGIDNEWVQNTDLQTVRYFLPPGKYVFQIYASRFFDKDVKAMKEIRITINPPYWKTWWFIAGIALLLFIILAKMVNKYNKDKYEKKLSVLENEHKIQLERERISRDLHDNIGAYANAVLYKTELLQEEEDNTERKELMKDLKFASKEIITSMRETIWALKKKNYTAEDCLLRIKNFIQPFGRYYPEIKFTIDGDAPVEKELHYAKALNLVRIIQEAVNNAIKHTTARNITITTKPIGDKWELAVTNDGNGFDYDKVKGAASGDGISNMKQRANDSGFEISITSNAKRGTCVRILI